MIAIQWLRIWSPSNDMPHYRTKELNIEAFMSGISPHIFAIQTSMHT